MSLNTKGARDLTQSHEIKEKKSYLYGVISAAAPSPSSVLREPKKDPLRFGGVEGAAEALEYNLFANYKPRLKHDQAAAPLRSGLYPEAREELA